MKKLIVLFICVFSTMALGYEVPPALRDGTIIVKTKDGNETKFDANKWKVVPRTDKKPSVASSTKCCPKIVEKPCPDCICPACSSNTATATVNAQPVEEPNYNRLSLVFGVPADMFDKDKYETGGEYEAGVTPVSIVYTRDWTKNFHTNLGYSVARPNLFLLGGGFNF